MRSVFSIVACGAVGLVAACGGATSGDPPGSSSGTSGSPVDHPASDVPTCDATKADDLEVSGADRDGFPPYAVAACTLVYVSGTGELHARDLTSGTETTLATASEHPRRPAVSDGVIAWEADENGHSVVRVVTRNGGAASPTTVTGTFVAAGEPRTSGSSVVFTAWNGPNASDDTDIWLFDTVSGEERMVLGGPGQQRFADVSSGYVVASDFSEDSDGRFDGNETDVADLVFVDLRTKAVSTRRLPGKQSFPILGEGDSVAYLDWATIHPEPKLQAYAVKSGQLAAAATADRTIATVEYVSTTYARPTLTGSTLEWVANPNGPTRLYRAPLNGSEPPAVVAGLDGLRLYAPASTRAFSLLAAAPQSASTDLPRLRAVAR